MYVNAVMDHKRGVVRVLERNENGERILKDYAPEWTFYYDSEYGEYKNIYGENVAKFSTSDANLFHKKLRSISGRTYESSISPIYRCIETHYNLSPVPPLYIGYFDIETDFIEENGGHAEPSNPVNPINTVSLKKAWENKIYTLTVKPSSLTDNEANKICGQFEDTILCPDEATLLILFLELIHDVDILVGFNSELYDIPYIYGRILRVLGIDAVNKLSLWDIPPTEKTFEKFGKTQITYLIKGRLHLDIQQLYIKYTYHELPSYSLDYIANYELGERKTEYTGSLNDLYFDNYQLFLEYSRQDVELLHKLENKLKHINLTMAYAHQNNVLPEDTIGAVKLSDMAIINEFHRHGMVVPDKKKTNDGGKLPGAYVTEPKIGLQEYIGSVDINSLYPSIMIAMNMSPETMIGQIDISKTLEKLQKKVDEGEKFSNVWNPIFVPEEVEYVINGTDDMVTIVFDQHSDWAGSYTMTGKELHDIIYNPNSYMVISANGTIFRSDKSGILAELLKRWFSERKEMNNRADILDKFNSGIEIPESFIG